MAGYTEIVLAICGILTIIAFLYLFVIWAFARRMRQIGQQISATRRKNAAAYEPQQTNVPTPSDSQQPLMKQCNQCGKVLIDEFGFCPRCGYDLQ